MATPGLYEIVGTYGAAIDGCCRVTAAESENELIFAYGELGNMMPVDVGKEVAPDKRWDLPKDYDGRQLIQHCIPKGFE